MHSTRLGTSVLVLWLGLAPAAVATLPPITSTSSASDTRRTISMTAE